MKRLLHPAAALIAAVALTSACGGKRSEKLDQEQDPTSSGGGTRGNFQNSTIGEIFQGGSSSTGGQSLTPVNRHLWRASLDTLAFLPLNSTDPFTGVIATDWAASPDSPSERFKVSAYVTSTSLSAQSLKVAVFREIRNQNGGWQSAPVTGETARQLEDAILVRARQLRIESREAS